MKHKQRQLPYIYIQNQTQLLWKKWMEQRLYQSDVARLFNVSSDCITYWENNRSEPQVQYYPHIIKFLGYFPFELDPSTFVGKIKAYRYFNGLSQKRFAKLMNVDPATATRWEEGKGGGIKKMEVEAILLSYDMAINQGRETDSNPILI